MGQHPSRLQPLPQCPSPNPHADKPTAASLRPRQAVASTGMDSPCFPPPPTLSPSLLLPGVCLTVVAIPQTDAEWLFPWSVGVRLCLSVGVSVCLAVSAAESVLDPVCLNVTAGEGRCLS